MKIKVQEANNNSKMGFAVSRQNINFAMVTVKKINGLNTMVQILNGLKIKLICGIFTNDLGLII